jgi:predicted double-glycine peptidase
MKRRSITFLAFALFFAGVILTVVFRAPLWLLFLLTACLSFCFVSRGRNRPAERKPRKPKHLPVVLFRQTTDYSCTASVLQALVHSFTGELLEHEHAIRLTRCRPKGASLEKVAKALSKRCGTKSKPLKSLNSARSALRAGKFVISHDSTTYQPQDHAVLLVGTTQKGWYVADSNLPSVKWRSDNWLRAAANEFIALYPGLPRRKCPQKRSKVVLKEK